MNKYIFAFIVLFVSIFINAIYASGGVMSTGGFSFDQNDILSARSIAISIVAIIIIVLLLKTFISWLKAWDKRCYEEDPTAVPNIEKETTYGLKIFTVIFILIAIRIPNDLILFAILLIPVAIMTDIMKVSFYILGLKSAAVKNRIEGCFGILLMIGLIGIMVIIVARNIPTGGHVSRWQARQKACYSNIRVLQGSVEMYNMDNVKMMETLETLDISLLEKWGYIKPGIKCPESNSFNYKSFGDLSSDGVIGCGDEPVGGNNNNMKKNHGTLNGKSKHE